MHLCRQFTLLAAATVTLLFFGCGGSEEGDAPTPPPVGTTWSVDMNSGTWLLPENIDGLRGLITGAFSTLLGVQSVQAGSVNLTLALADDGAQDFCNRTVSMNGVSLTAPAQLHFGPADFSLANGVTTKALEINATMSEDFSSLHTIEMRGNIQLGTFPPGFLPIGDDDVCDYLALADVQCEACDNGQVACLNSHIVGMTATRVDDLVLETVTQDGTHPNCASEEGT